MSWCSCTDEASVRHGCVNCAGALVREGISCHAPGLPGCAGEGVLGGTGARSMEILRGAWVATEAIRLAGRNPLPRGTCGRPGGATFTVPVGNPTEVETRGSSGATVETAGALHVTVAAGQLAAAARCSRAWPIVKGTRGCAEDSRGGAGGATGAWTTGEGWDSASNRAAKPGGAATGCLSCDESCWHWSRVSSKPSSMWWNWRSWSRTSWSSRLLLRSEALSLEELDGHTPSDEDLGPNPMDMRVNEGEEVSAGTKFSDARETNSPLEVQGT